MFVTAARYLVIMQNLILDAIRAILFLRMDPKPPKTILVVRFGAIGDFVVALPAFRLLRRSFCSARIILLTAPSLKDRRSSGLSSGAVLAGNRLVDEKILLPALGKWQRLKEIRSQIRRLDPDLCVLLPFSAEPFRGRLMKILLVRLLGARKNLHGYHTRASLGFFRRPQHRAGLYEHQLNATLRAIREAGVVDDEIVFEIETAPEDVRRVEEWWEQHGLSAAETLIAICPASKEHVKCWPLENFRALGFRLLEDPRLRIVVLGGKEDVPNAELLIESWGERGVTFAGKASILQSAGILRRCKIFVGVDSGPMHLAAALGLPVVGIFASVVFPVLWRPWGKESFQLRHSVPCEFCFTTSGVCPTGTMDCIRGIRVDDVLEAVRRILRLAQNPQAPLMPSSSFVAVPGGRS